jgi:predicted GIY-YIG superfamily endonuclease
LSTVAHKREGGQIQRRKRRQNLRVLRLCAVVKIHIFDPSLAVLFASYYGSQIAWPTVMQFGKRFVYILKNDSKPARYYTGVTSDVAARLFTHNAGRCTHTASGRPWHIDVVIEFSDEGRALVFERYLKSGSGAAFAIRHFR